MKFEKKKNGEGVVKSVFIAYFILVFHIALIVGIGLLVIFFRGLINYMLWIFLAVSAAILISGYFFYRRMKKEKKSLGEMLATPMFNGRPVEVSLLGGLASIKVGRPSEPLAIENIASPHVPLLEDPHRMQLRELNELARLFEKNLITQDEYNKAKEMIFNS